MKIGESQPASVPLEKADRVVSFAKAISREVSSFTINDVDFVGCSMPYVKEKLDSAIYDLQWLKRTLAAVDKLQHEKKMRSIRNET